MWKPRNMSLRDLMRNNINNNFFSVSKTQALIVDVQEKAVKSASLWNVGVISKWGDHIYYHYIKILQRNGFFKGRRGKQEMQR